MSVIPCITWVRKGKSKQKPEKVNALKITEASVFIKCGVFRIC